MSELDSAAVAAYLQQHPEFFNEHLALLEHLTIPHPSGQAVSLISRQLELFRQRHHEMETQLNGLIEIARDNDSSANNIHELTLAVLEADSLPELVDNLQLVMAECFLTDFIALKIIHAGDYPPALQSLFVHPDAPELAHFRQELSSNQANCGMPTFAQAKFLFADHALAVKSSAIIPMMFTEVEGLIAVGSREDQRFHYSMGHFFLTQISEIVGTRLASMLKSLR